VATVRAAASFDPLTVARAPHDMAIDLGTAYLRVFARGRGLIAEEPSVVRVWREPLALAAVGAQAVAPSSGPQASFPVHPLRKGVVFDVRCAGWLLSPAMRRARGLSLIQPAVLACAPSDASAEEVGSLREALRSAGAARVTVVPEPLAAAVGACLDVTALCTHMLVDVGDGVTDIAVIRAGRIEQSLAVRVGCSDLRKAVVNQLAGAEHLPAPAAAIDEVIRQADAPLRHEQALSVEIERGPALRVSLRVERTAILASMGPVLDTLSGAVRRIWTGLTAGESREVRENGIWVTGGGALLHAVQDRVARATGVEARVPPRPLHAVILGASRLMLSPQPR
jgi:rod shape-determining protein MreB and related proteins